MYAEECIDPLTHQCIPLAIWAAVLTKHSSSRHYVSYRLIAYKSKQHTHFTPITLYTDRCSLRCFKHTNHSLIWSFYNAFDVAATSVAGFTWWGFIEGHSSTNVSELNHFTAYRCRGNSLTSSHDVDSLFSHRLDFEYYLLFDSCSAFTCSKPLLLI